MNATSWIDRDAYPFQSHYFDADGGRMHYVDEGQGRPLVMVHGTPTWSFLYRKLIKDLSGEYRIIVPDHIGFGLSDKPPVWPYRPQDHARNLKALISHLGLLDITLVVHDFGGPIGLSYAIHHPDNVRALVLFNTFLWSLRGDPAFERSNRMFNNRFGKWLYRKQNFSARMIMRMAWGKHRPITPQIHRHYTQPFANPDARMGTVGFLESLLGESEWYEQIWSRRENIAGKPALLLWGLRDIAFKEKELARWKGLFANEKVVRYPNVGHFVPDEAGEEAAAEIRAFLKSTEEAAL